jgi:hypothetical protein
MPEPTTHGDYFQLREVMNHLIDEHGFELLIFGSYEHLVDGERAVATALLGDPKDPLARTPPSSESEDLIVEGPLPADAYESRYWFREELPARPRYWFREELPARQRFWRRHRAPQTLPCDHCGFEAWKTHHPYFRLRELMNHMIAAHGFELINMGTSKDGWCDPTRIGLTFVRLGSPVPLKPLWWRDVAAKIDALEPVEEPSPS